MPFFKRFIQVFLFPSFSLPTFYIMLSKFSFYFGFTKIIFSYFLFSLGTVLLPWQPRHHHPTPTALAKTRLSLVCISFTSSTFSHQLLFFKNTEKELFTIDWHWFFFPQDFLALAFVMSHLPDNFPTHNRPLPLFIGFFPEF